MKTVTQQANIYDVLARYNASGLFGTTTGTISSSSNSLAVASNSGYQIGQGIFILGAGGSQRSVANGVTNGTTTITSSTIAFKSDDVGKLITGTNIPAGAYIVSLNSATSAVISQAATGSGSSITFTLMKDLVAVITDISSTTFTLDRNASNSVTSVLVQHDDTFAINQAMADAFNGNGGTVILPFTGCDGYYRCNAPFNATSNSILTIPTVNSYTNPITVELNGEFESEQSNARNTACGGVVIDCQNAPVASGTAPALLAGSPFILITNANVGMIGLTSWYNLAFFTNGITYLIAGNPTISGLQFGNTLQCTIGDKVTISANQNTVAPTTSTSYGLYMPQRLNNARSTLGSAIIGGFYNGVFVGEHTRLYKPYIVYCVNGIILSGIANPIVGTICIENTINQIVADPNNPLCSVRLTVESEYVTTGAFAFGGTFVTDPNNAMSGIIEHHIANATANTIVGMTTNGATNVRFEGLSYPANKVQRQVLTTTASSVSFTIPGGYTNFRLRMDVRGDDATSSSLMYAQFNGDTGNHYSYLIQYSNVNNSPAATLSASSDGVGELAVGDIACGTAVANYSTSIEFVVFNYAGTTFYKNSFSKVSFFYPTGGSPPDYNAIEDNIGNWQSTAAITSINLIAPGGDNFIAGSTFVLEME